ncbi:MAG TPA: TOBE domain-containing protein, partial [Blastocatellia bacterium]|nr:TOBE domain-containing protein [Blastocatellia bacterium]
TVESSNGQVSLINLGRVSVTAEGNRVSRGERVRVMIRPEKIRLSPDDSDGAIRGEVESGVYLGDSTQWRVVLEGGQAITALEQNREPFRSSQNRVGQKVSVSWEPGSAVILKG